MNLAEIEPKDARRERLEARVTTGQKELFEQAAHLRGLTLTSFIVSSLEAVARQIVREQETIVLSAKDRQAFVGALLRPSVPRGRLARAVKRYKSARSGK